MKIDDFLFWVGNEHNGDTLFPLFSEDLPTAFQAGIITTETIPEEIKNILLQVIKVWIFERI